MSFGYTPESFGLIIVFGFVGIIVLGLFWRLFRAALRAVGVKSDGLSLAMFASLIAGLLLAGSLALDTFGERATALVTSKRETIQVTAQGGWRRTYQVGVRATGGGVAQIATLSPSDEEYDAVVEGDELGVRMLRAGSLSVVRDDRDNTWTILPWTWLLGLAIAVVMLVLAWRHLASLIIVIVVLGGVTLPLVNAYRDWRAAEDMSGITERATGTVRDVTRVTEWRFRTRASASSGERAFDEFQLPQHYDVVTLDLQPTGLRGPVLGVDAVDVAQHAPPVLAPGTRVDVRFAPRTPRDVRLDGHTRRWHWRDMLSVYGQIWFALAAVVAAAVAWAWFKTVAQRRLALTGRPGRGTLR
ncbi:MAG: hypothetical protein ABJA98_17960 [Acidobacteriota bacterium]